jgi:hypothetical protein
VTWYGEGAVKPWPLKVPLKNLKSRVEPTVLPFWPKLICVKLAKSTEMGQHIFFSFFYKCMFHHFRPEFSRRFLQRARMRRAARSSRGPNPLPRSSEGLRKHVMFRGFGCFISSKDDDYHWLQLQK